CQQIADRRPERFQQIQGKRRRSVRDSVQASNARVQTVRANGTVHLAEEDGISPGEQSVGRILRWPAAAAAERNAGWKETAQPGEVFGSRKPFDTSQFLKVLRAHSLVGQPAQFQIVLLLIRLG